MIFPTLAGLISSPLKVFTIAADDTTITAQQFVDGVYGGALIGAVAKTVRDDSVVLKTLGPQALSKVKAARIVGFI